MRDERRLNVWFVTGSQNLYGEETLRQVASDAQAVAKALDASEAISAGVVFKPVVTTPDAILQVCRDANSADDCVGVICWMHTFSPAKMWIAGLRTLQKPMLHLHTQFNRDLPWGEIDMDFMNLNQSAHGGREFGFMVSRLRIDRKVVVGHWAEADVQQQVDTWVRAARGWHAWQHARIARFGDNMREVAVTEGDKVEAQIQFGFAVHGFGVGDLAAQIAQVNDKDVSALVDEYRELYTFGAGIEQNEEKLASVRREARTELGTRAFLEEGGFTAFTNTFEDLHGFEQLPGMATQRLMAAGYGYGAEGDWKTAALLRAMKVMGSGLAGGASFMEDYTYHLGVGTKVLGAHMLEVCPTIAAGKPVIDVQPLGIGGKSDPVRLVFTGSTGPAVNATVIDMGNRFRMLINLVECVEPDAELPKLPVARAVWLPKPNLATAAAAWILGGGTHHTAFSQSLEVDHLVDFAEMAGIEALVIDEASTVREIKNQLRWNAAYYGLRSGI